MLETYIVTTNGLPYTVQLTPETAERLGATKAVNPATKKTTPVKKAGPRGVKSNPADAGK